MHGVARVRATRAQSALALPFPESYVTTTDGPGTCADREPVVFVTLVADWGCDRTDMISLRLLGTVDVRDDSESPIDTLLRRPRRLAILSYLAAARPFGLHRRDSLIALFWPETPHDNARHALSQALHVLRQELQSDAILARGEDVGLDHSVIRCDVLEFERFVEQADYEPALDLYRGHLMDGFFISGAPAFDRWLDDERTRLIEAAAGAAWALSYQQVHNALLVDAERTAQRALALVPTDESEVRRFIDALASAGDRAAAVQFYKKFRDRLASDYDLEPAPETADLAHQIRTRKTPAGRWGLRIRPSGSTPAAGDDGVELDPPLVGRTATYESAFSEAEAACTSGPLCLVVLGSRGMGKTRLLQECSRRIADAGGIVALARPLPSDHDSPFSTLRLLLRGGLAGAPGFVAADPRAVSLLASIDPQLAERVEPIAPLDTGDVAGALASVLRAISEEHPAVLAIDDAHLSDGRTIETLQAAVWQLETAPMLALLTVDPSADNAPPSLTRFRSQVGRELRGTTVRLDPLTPIDTRKIVESLAPWCSAEEDLDRLARRVHFETAGNPFLSTTLLRHLEHAPTIRDDLLAWPTRGSTYESPLPISVPDLVRLSVVARVGGLDEDTIQVLRAASIGGIGLDLSLIAALAETDVMCLEPALDRLEKQGFITYNGHRYAFAAPILAETVRGEYLTHGQRQRLRRRAAKVLAERDDLESRVLRVELLARSDPGGSAFDEAVSVVRAAVEADSDRTARRALVAAERAAMDDGKKLGVLKGLWSELGERANP